MLLGAVAARSPVHHDPDPLLHRPLGHQVIQADFYSFPNHGKGSRKKSFSTKDRKRERKKKEKKRRTREMENKNRDIKKDIILL